MVNEAGVSVCMVPVDAGNPYQGELATALRSSGVGVTLRRDLKGLFFGILRGKERPDLVHLHWLPRYQPDFQGWFRAFLYLTRLTLLRMVGRRIVWTVHNLYSHEGGGRRMARWLTNRVLARVDGVIVHSKTAVDLVTEEFDVRREQRLTVVPHGNFIGSYPNVISRTEARNHLQVDPGGVGFLFLGNIRPYKGVCEFVRAYTELREPSSFLLIAGKPRDEEIAAEVGRMVSADQRIQFRPGVVPDEEIQHYMNACDVVVFPYQNVLTSGAVILAMSFGRACIAPKLGCIPDVLDERGGFLYDPGDADGLRLALERAVREQGRLEGMGAYNLERAQEWGWDRIARETAEVYTRCLG